MRRRIALPGFLAALIALGLLAASASALPRTFYGVTAAETPTARDLDGMANARVGLLRLNVAWSAVQRTDGGPLDFSELDPVVADAATRGIDLLPVLYSSPTWAVDCSQAPAGACETMSPTSSARGATAWQAFVLALAQRYGPGGTFWSDTSDAFNPPNRPIRRWQIWNEVNSPEFFQPKPTASAYARLLSASADAIRSVDPRAKIYLAGLFGTPPKPGISSRRFLNGLYSIKGAKSDFDVVAVHPYSPGAKGMLFQVQVARDAMVKHRDRRTPLAVTEIGWSSGPPSGGILLRGPAGQARALKAAFRALLRDRRRDKLDGVVWFSWRDPAGGTTGSCSFCAGAGLLNNDYSPKPAFGAFTGFTGGA